MSIIWHEIQLGIESHQPPSGSEPNLRRRIKIQIIHHPLPAQFLTYASRLGDLIHVSNKPLSISVAYHQHKCPGALVLNRQQ